MSIYGHCDRLRHSRHKDATTRNGIFSSNDKKTTTSDVIMSFFSKFKNRSLLWWLSCRMSIVIWLVFFISQSSGDWYEWRVARFQVSGLRCLIGWKAYRTMVLSKALYMCCILYGCIDWWSGGVLIPFLSFAAAYRFTNSQTSRRGFDFYSLDKRYQ